MFDIYDLALGLPFLMLLVIYWWNSSDQKSVAVAAARAYCRERQLQLLDGTLAFHRFRLERNDRDQRRLCRVYRFDYCQSGADRHTGELILNGYSVLRVILHGETLEITEY